MRYSLSVLLLALGPMASCAAPSLDGVNWSCATNADCGEGFLCSITAGVCLAGDTGGTNGVFEDRLVLGMSNPLTTGPVGLGLGMKAGIESYFHYLNGRGGVHGRTLELMALDDGYDPPRALANMHQLLDSKSVFAVIGNVGTPTANVTAPYAVEQKAIFFGAFTGAGLLRKDPPDRYVFNYRASYQEETAQMVRFFTSTRDSKIDPHNIAVLPQGENSAGLMDPFGKSGFDGVARQLKAAFDIPAEQIAYWTYARNTVEVKPAAKVLLKWLADGNRPKVGGQISAAIIMVPTYKPAAQFVKAMLETLSIIKRNGAPDPDYQLSDTEQAELKNVKELLFSSVSFVGANDFATELVGMGNYTNLAGAQDKFCNRIIVSQVVPLFSSSASGVLAYREHLAAFDPNQTPGFVSLEGYLAARLFVAGLEKIGRALNPESFIDTLETLDNVDLGVGVPLAFSPNRHQASDKVWGSTMDANCVYGTIEL